MHDFSQSLILGWRVAMRHWAIYRKDFFANILPTLVDPALFILVFGYWLGSQIDAVGGRPYLAFMAPGIATTTVLFTAYFETSYGFYVRLQFENIFKAMMTTPIGPNEIIMGEFFWVAMKGAIMALFVSAVLVCFGVVQVNYLVLMPLMGIMVGLACGAMGLIATSYIHNMNQFQTVYALLISPMFFISGGVFVPVASMPQAVQVICYFSPIYHGVRLAQSALWMEDVLRSWLIHGGSLILLTAVLMVWAWRRIIPKLYQ